MVSSEEETQFIPLSNDDEYLWEVEEIVGENPKQFKIRWKGIDPETGKPWEDSWVAKHDVTQDTVAAWRLIHPKSLTPKKKTRKSNLKAASEAATAKYLSRSKVSYISKSEYDDFDEPPSAGPSKTRTKKRKREASETESEAANESVSATLAKLKKRKRQESLAGDEESKGKGKERERHPSSTAAYVLVESPRKKKKVVEDVQVENMARKTVTAPNSSATVDQQEEKVGPPKRGRGRAKKSNPSVPKSAKQTNFVLNPDSPLALKQNKSSAQKPVPIVAPQPLRLTPPQQPLVREPILSPAALARLKEFDDFFASLPPDDVQDDPPVPVRARDPTPGQDEADNADQYLQYPDSQPQLQPQPELVQQPPPKPAKPVSVSVSVPAPPAVASSSQEGDSSIIPETEFASSQSQSQNQGQQPPQNQPQLEPQSKPAETRQRPQEQEQEQEREHTPVSPVQPFSIPSMNKPGTNRRDRIDNLDPGLSEHDRNISKSNAKADTIAKFVGAGGSGGGGGGSSSRERANSSSKLKQQPKLMKELRPIPFVSPSTFRPHLPSATARGGGRRLGDQYDDDDDDGVEEADESIEQWPSPVKPSGIGNDHAVNGHLTSLAAISTEGPGGGEDKSQGERRSKSPLKDISTGKPVNAVISLEEGEIPASQQSIEEGEIRTSQRIIDVPPSQQILKNALGSSQDSEALAVQIRTRGLEMAEVAEVRKRLERERANSDGRRGKEKRRSLEEIVKDDGSGGSSSEKSKGKGKEVEKEREVEIAVDEGHDVSGEGNVEPQFPEESLGLEQEVPMSIPVPQDSLSRPQGLLMDPIEKNKSSSASSPGPALAHVPVLNASNLVDDEHLASIATLTARIKEMEEENASLRQKVEESMASLSKEREQSTSTSSESHRRISQLEQDVSSALSAKLSAEKDRDFFKDQWSTASAYTTTVRAENTELLKRVEIAERQASEGVSLIRASFEEKLRKKEEDELRFSRIAEFMMKKDARTDEVRQMAAEAPEWKAKCEELEREVRGLREEVERLESEIDVEQLKVEELERQVESANEEKEEERKTWRKEVEESRGVAARLMGDLNEAKSEAQRNGENAQGTGKKVFRCEWRKEGSDPCLFICETRQELEDHTVHGGHIIS